ncbi:unnamed protein product [Arctogadus glacialis]
MIQGAEEWQNQRPLLGRKPEVSPPHQHARISQNRFPPKGREVVSQTLLPDWLAWFSGGGTTTKKTNEKQKGKRKTLATEFGASSPGVVHQLDPRHTVNSGCSVPCKRFHRYPRNLSPTNHLSLLQPITGLHCLCALR